MNKIYNLLFITILITSGCGHNGSFSVEGSVEEGEPRYAYISRINIDTPELIDSAVIKDNGTFRFRIRASEPDFYQLGVSPDNFITLLAEPGEKIRLVFSNESLFESYTVSGSGGSEKIRELDMALAITKRKLDSLKGLYIQASGEPGFETSGPSLESEMLEIVEKQRTMNIEFIINNMSSLAMIKALYQKIDDETYVLYDEHDLQFLKLASDSLRYYYPNSRHVKALHQDYEKELNRMYVNQLGQLANELPVTELDPHLENVDGKRVALSSLRGKYVLFTFWSVRSGECLTENLQLKEYYRLYNKKGFEIYQVNLDENPSDWKLAVNFDELPWISTREDDPINPKYARIFNVRSLPANYLFDKEGNIIATNLHGRSLRLKLEQLFN